MTINVTGGARILGGGSPFTFKTVDNSPPAGKELWGWGYGRQLMGQGASGGAYSSPTQVGALTDWSSVSVPGNHSHATKNDGTLWSWGTGTSGELGNGDNINASSPIQIGGLTDWLSASLGGGDFHAIAVKTDGTLWSWGQGTSGKTGQANTDNISSPTQVGALTDWASVSASGQETSFAVKTDGTAWSWGSDQNRGVLGLGDNNINRSSPVQIGALTDWSAISCGDKIAVALKTDGTMWSWGANYYGDDKGALGLGDVVTRSSPTQIGALTTWDSHAVGKNHTLAIKTDGTLWSWGKGDDGNLGHGNVNDLSSPSQVGSLTDWAACSCDVETNSFAIKTDGTAWSWGSNSSGRLGQGDVIARSSPVQIGSATNWDSIDAAGNHTMAIRTP